jgi:hypothetical protein
MKKAGFTIRVGPLGLSLVAAAVTAAALAAISLADNGGSDSGDRDKGPHIFRAPAPPGGGAGVMMFRDDLSDADRKKLEEFRQCMEDNGAPAPPDPGEFDPSNPPKPPSEADRDKLKSAFEACKASLPDELQRAGPPRLHLEGCAPPPGAPGTDERGKNENQSNDSGASSSGGTT